VQGRDRSFSLSVVVCVPNGERVTGMLRLKRVFDRRTLSLLVLGRSTSRSGIGEMDGEIA
jgi:hypothetical protein